MDTAAVVTAVTAAALACNNSTGVRMGVYQEKWPSRHLETHPSAFARQILAACMCCCRDGSKCNSPIQVMLTCCSFRTSSSAFP
jgi:hypothetical protein